MATLLLFFDGIGIGRDDPGANPFAAVEARRLAPLAGRDAEAPCAFRPLDATLGVPGLPQSATGQTTLLTGVNAARFLGRHQTGVPGPSLRGLIARESLFRKLVAAGRRPTFANAYTSEHLEARRPRWSATTRMVMASRVPFRMVDREEPEGRALCHDYTGEWFRRRGFLAERRDAGAAAAVLLGLLEGHDVVLYEYFLTDLAGHRGDAAERRDQALRVEALVDACVGGADLSRDRVVVFSDHGNLEDQTHPRHTRNPVPLLAWGAAARDLVDRVDGLEALTPALLLHETQRQANRDEREEQRGGR